MVFPFLSANRPALAKLSDAADEFHAILNEGTIHTVFQPIVSFRDGSVLGYEALSRGPAGSRYEKPTDLFAKAAEMGMTWELEYACRCFAIERFSALSFDNSLLFLNINPHIVVDSRFREGATRNRLQMAGIPPAQVVFELTEKSAVTDYDAFSAILEHYRSQGFRIAIDDTGAGHSGLTMICQIKPHYLKLDMALIRNLHLDSFKQQLVKFTVDFARATNITIIAEGVELEAELYALHDLGVEYGQGYYFARPHTQLQAMSDELVAQLVEMHRRRLDNKLQRLTTASVGDSCRAKPPCQADTLCNHIESRFTADETLIGIPIVEGGKPCGIIMRDKFFTRLGRQYGYSLFQHRPVSHVMDTHPLVVDYHEPLEAVSQAAMKRSQSCLYDHIIVTVNGYYFGLITVRDLLERITEQGIKYAQYANPLTGLPGNIIVQREIERVINTAEQFSVLYIDLDNFKAYNDVYGFDRGDEILRFTAQLLQDTFSDPIRAETFIGHIGGDDFVVVTPAIVAEEYLNLFQQKFDAKVVAYYDEEHRSEGCIRSINRRGEEESFPFISVSVAIVTSENGTFENYHSLAKRATEVKKLCKAILGSCFVFDRRQ